ncbi:glycosyltransferase [Vibrio sinaloensis]|uniref:Glycosyl transferase n=1 Tax=Photobacterium sp. (strain ATCC 43367) TaxID=379097 RepID=A0A0A5I4I4_PHOS4|nr:glycosyltransferase [Vibrio sinaloensis]KGY10654.1 glycosyl transferase [Vibrio sinaloensis]
MRDLIVFGEDFGGLPSSTQHLITRLAHDRRILWVNSIGLRQPRLSKNDIGRAWNKLLGKAKQGYQTSSQQHPNIHVANIKTIPAPSSAFARAIAKQLMVSQLKPIIKMLQLKEPILWTSLPTAADVCGHLNESAVVYYCGDDFTSLAGVDHDVVREHEVDLVSHANLVLAASDKLCLKFPRAKTHFLPHGVDVSLFTQPHPRALDLPSSGKPIAGFYGSLSNWLDYKMLDQLCKQRTDWEFVFIGPLELSHNPLPRLPNVHYLGAKAHHELPQYSQHWSVGLLPFLLNDQIRACSPLKLKEYLAAGSAVISSPFPAAYPYQNQLQFAQTVNEFSAALDRVQQQPSKQTHMHFIDESWDSRSIELSRLLEAI